MTRRKSEIAISEAELASLTNDLEDRHADTLPQMHQAGVDLLEQMHEGGRGLISRTHGRRNFLKGAVAVTAGGAVLAACGTAASAQKPAGAPKTSKEAQVDLEVAVLAASLENLAVSTYQAGISAAVAGKLGAVPPAVVTFAKTAMAQHADHAKAWNAIVTTVGYKSVTASDPALTGLVNADLTKVTDVGSLAKLALNLETIAAATYLEALYAVSSKQALSIAASIQPVEMQHVAILNFVLGTYPVPNAFSNLTGARPPSETKSLIKK